MAVRIRVGEGDRALDTFLYDFQAHLLAACEGKGASHEKEYHDFRAALLADERLAPLVPAYIRRHRTPEELWAFFKSFNGQWEPRRQMIRGEFAPLFDVAEARAPLPTLSGTWTGRRTFKQQVSIAHRLTPAARQGIDLLMAMEFASLHNGGPVDDDRAAALQALRELHVALGELLDAASSEGAFTAALVRLKGLSRATFKWHRDSYQLAVAALPLSTATTVIGAGVMAVVAAITKDAPVALALGSLAGGATIQAGKKPTLTSAD